MEKPKRESYRGSKGIKNIRYSNKPYAADMEKYCAFLEGVISGKHLKIPKDQLPLPAPKPCEDCKKYRAIINEILQLCQLTNESIKERNQN